MRGGSDGTGATGAPGAVDAAAPDHRSGEHGHVPVMSARIVELLAPALEAAGRDAVILDATLGAGGHAEALLGAFPGARLIGIDRDPSALEGARARLARFGDRFSGHRARFDELADVLRDAGADGVDAALFDLGVSSMQLDQRDRGFAYRVDAPLDMRMDPTSGPTAADVLNTYPHGELARVLSEHGDERFAGRIASAIVRERGREPFTTSGRLVELLYDAIPAASRRTGGHPAKRTFQALRVEVNREMDSLAAALPAAARALRVGGRMAFMSYQSHEDRMVKRCFAELCRSTTPPGLPMELPGHEARFSMVTRGAERAGEDEIGVNRRAAPVRVRCLTRDLPDETGRRRR